MFLDEGMRIQKRADPFAKRSGAVAVNDAHARLVTQSRVIQKLVEAVGGLLIGVLFALARF